MSDKNKRKRARLQANRRLRLQEHAFEGWRKCSDFHYQKVIMGKTVNWWPTRRKCGIHNKTFTVYDENEIISLVQNWADEPAQASA